MDPYFQIPVAIESTDLLLHLLHTLAVLPHLLLPLHPIPFLRLLIQSPHHPLLLILLGPLHLLAHLLLSHRLLSHHPLGHRLLGRRLLELHPLGLHPLDHHPPAPLLPRHPTLTFNPDYSIIVIASEHITTNTILHLIHKPLPLHPIAIPSHYSLHTHTIHLQQPQATVQSLRPSATHQ